MKTPRTIQEKIADVVETAKVLADMRPDIDPSQFLDVARLLEQRVAAVRQNARARLTAFQKKCSHAESRMEKYSTKFATCLRCNKRVVVDPSTSEVIA